MPHGLQDLSSTTRDWTQAVRVLSPSHWATKEFPLNCFLVFKIVFLLTLLRYDWQIKIASIKAVWCGFFQRCTTRWFNICCEMITMIKEINISITSHCDHFVCVCVMRTLKICFLIGVPVYKISVVNCNQQAVHEIPELIYLINESLHPLTSIFPFLPLLI